MKIRFARQGAHGVFGMVGVAKKATIIAGVGGADFDVDGYDVLAGEPAVEHGEMMIELAAVEE